MKYIFSHHPVLFYLYFTKGIKCTESSIRVNVDSYSFLMRLGITIRCRGINRKHPSGGDGFWKIWLSKPASEVGVLEKKIEIRLGFASPNFNFFSKTPTSEAGFETKFSKTRHHRRGICTNNLFAITVKIIVYYLGLFETQVVTRDM